MPSLREECLGSPEKVVMSILREWVQGKGLPVTWESLIQSLRDSGLSTLADEIATAKSL